MVLRHCFRQLCWFLSCRLLIICRQRPCSLVLMFGASGFYERAWRKVSEKRCPGKPRASECRGESAVFVFGWHIERTSDLSHSAVFNRCGIQQQLAYYWTEVSMFRNFVYFNEDALRSLSLTSRSFLWLPCTINSKRRWKVSRMSTSTF